MGFFEGFIKACKHQLLLILISWLALAPLMTAWLPAIHVTAGMFFYDLFAFALAYKAILMTFALMLFLWEYIMQPKLLVFAFILIYLALRFVVLPGLGLVGA